MKTIALFFLFVSTITLAQNNPNPELFLPDFFQEFPNVRDLSISNDKSEMYFTVESFKKEFSFIAYSKKKNGNWAEPQVVSFSGKDKDLEPFLSPDNLRLYFASNRNTVSNEDKTDFDIWYVERESLSSDWGKPINIGTPINTDKDEFYPAITNSGNLYFTATRETDTKGKEDIYMSKFENGKYLAPRSLSDAVNSETYEFNAYVSPNEDVIVYSSYRRPDGVGSTDLYISVKDENGNWQEAKNLGKQINSPKTEYCPLLDLENYTLYFTSDVSTIPSKMNTSKTTEELRNIMHNAPNGMSRIYAVELDRSLFE